MKKQTYIKTLVHRMCHPLLRLITEAPNPQITMASCRAGHFCAVPTLLAHSPWYKVKLLHTFSWGCSEASAKGEVTQGPCSLWLRGWALQKSRVGLYLQVALPNSYSGRKPHPGIVGSPCSFALLQKLKHLNHLYSTDLGWITSSKVSMNHEYSACTCPQ